jgi:hypothetical protein
MLLARQKFTCGAGKWHLIPKRYGTTSAKHVPDRGAKADPTFKYGWL